VDAGDEPVIEVGDELVAIVLRRAGQQVTEHHDAGRAFPRFVPFIVPRALARSAPTQLVDPVEAVLGGDAVIEAQRELFADEVVADRAFVAGHRARRAEDVLRGEGRDFLFRHLPVIPHRPVDAPRAFCERLAVRGRRHRRRGRVAELLELRELTNPFTTAFEHVVLERVAGVEAEPHADLLGAIASKTYSVCTPENSHSTRE
jgi:hypothetical protein